MTQEDYLKERDYIVKREEIVTICSMYSSIFTPTLDDVIDTLNKIKRKFKNKEILGVVSEYNEYEDEVTLVLLYKDYETISETESRLYKKNLAKNQELTSLKEKIVNNPEEAVKIIKELGLI